MSSQPIPSNRGRMPGWNAIFKGVTKLMVLSDGSANTTDAFGADTTAIMVTVAKSGVYFDLGDPATPLSSGSNNPRAGYLGVGNYYFGTRPGHKFTCHQEDGASIVTVIEGAKN